MANQTVHPLDLNFQGRERAIGAYLIPHSQGAALVESGPGSTIPGLQKALAQYGLTTADITHVFLTHIHLDHAGAAGWLAQQGAQVYVHPVGAPHMLNPEKLLHSAGRLYGDRMDMLWGEFLPVPAEKLNTLEDGQEVDTGGRTVTAVFTPGHAEHHCAYLLEGYCFTGDVGGVRIPGYQYLRLPLVPPELHLEKWEDSIHKLQALKPGKIAPTHFGIFEDAGWHLQSVLDTLASVRTWMEEVMPGDPPLEELRQKFSDFLEAEGRSAGLEGEDLEVLMIANPTWVSADGIRRYWRKHCQTSL
ncbi:MAG: MBL fold metallo-hydrolase [Anaerolineales bacterium]|nr:MBL fold metallo-hydrolase [Anaerolineales bacterium]